MMLDQEQGNGPTAEQQPGKLVLPAPPEPAPGVWSAGPQQRTTYIAPEMLVRRPREGAPSTVTGKIAYFWSKDPAYKVFMIAIALVLIAGIIFSAIVGSALVQSSLNTQSASVPLTPPPGVAPTGTIDLHPTFSTPGGQGSNTSSQPATGPTPVLRPTATNGDFAIQLSSIPDSVPNGSDVEVTITTGQPNIAVQLQVSYNTAPFFYVVNGATDGNGVATLTWHVQVFSLGRRMQAKVKAVAYGPNGQHATSNTITVRIVGAGFN